MKLSRILFIIFGIVAPIAIGSLHTFVHFKDLMAPEINQYLQKEFFITDKVQPLWNAWGLMSFMMGAAFIIIGLLNWVTFRRLAKEEAPPVGSILVMMLYLICVIYAGYTFSAWEQFYGSIVGMIGMSVALFTSIKK